MKIISCNDECSSYLWYIPNANTLFYLKNDWEITDHSQYSHTMNRYWSQKFYTLSNWRKVVHFDWTNWILSNVFSEANNLTTFTLHFWRKRLWINDTNWIIFWRAWRKKDDSATLDRRWMRFQTVDGTNTWQKQETILFWDTVWNWWTVWTSNYIPVPETEFQLFTATVNWNVFKLYKNWVLQKSFTSTTIRWWSSTWPRYYLWKAFHPDWSLRAWWPLCYIWENVLEKKTETDAEVLDFYNKTKKHYWLS